MRGAAPQPGALRQIGSLLGHGLFEQRRVIPTLAIGVVVQVAVIFGIDRLGSPSYYLGLPGAAAALIGMFAAIAGGPAVGLTVALAGGIAYFAFITDFGTTVVWQAIVGSFVLWILAAGLAGLAGDWIRRRAADREAILDRSLLERQELLNAATESEERFRSMADAIPQLAWLAHADGYIYWFNQRWYSYTGTTPAQMEGWGWQSVHDPEELPKVLEGWKGSIATGEPFEMEFPLREADGVYHLFLTRVVPVRNDRGEIVQWVGTNTDVTESVRLRADLARQLRTTQLLLQTSEALAESTDLREVLQGLTQAVLGATVHGRASFALWDEARREMRFVASTGEEAIAPFAAPWTDLSPLFREMADALEATVADYDADAV